MESNPLHSIDLTQFFQEPLDVFFQTWMKRFRIDFAKGHQNKGSLMEARVGYLKVFANELVPVEEENV